jgi:hypothetical protein
LFVAETFVDHLTVTAPTLAAGAAFVNQVLGVAPQPGGEHPRMGTHNLLVRLGESLFLEVIAPNPNAAAPYRPRWFGLDCMRADALPSLSTWVVRTGDIHASVTACSEALGEIEPMSRGAINWLITIPADGSVPVDGVAPALIEWHTPVHPAAGLPDKGLSFVGLEIAHPEPQRLSRLLLSLDLQGPVTVRSPAGGALPHLVAHIRTPRGLQTLPFAAT